MKKLLSLLLVAVMLTALLASCTPAAVFESGVTDGAVYTNESIGLSFTLPEGWEYYTAEEIEEQLGSSAEDAGVEFMAIHPEAGSNVIFTVSDLGSAAAIMSADTFAAAMRLMADEDDTYSDTSGFLLGNLSFRMMTNVSKADDGDVHQYIFVQKFGRHMVSIICTTTEEDTSETFAAMFS